MSETSSERKSKLGLILTLLFALAMLMGPGPGLLLVNPDVNDPNAAYTIGAVPIIYAWGVFWYAVQLAVVITAYCTVWKQEDER